MDSSAYQSVRAPVVAGMFYPATPRECARAVHDLFAAVDPVELRPWIGALVPHAGWVCSGQIAATAIAAMKTARPAPDVVVVFGAVHTMAGTDYGAFDDHAAWHTPEGDVAVAIDVQEQMLLSAKYLRVDPRMQREKKRKKKVKSRRSEERRVG